MRYIVLDTETTGISPDQGHRIVEIAAIEIVNRKITENHFHLYVNPGRDSDPKALEVHGLTTAFLSQYASFSSSYTDFLSFVTGAALVIHNAPFDVAFLDAELMRIPVCKKLHHYCPQIIDTLPMARKLFPGKKNSLDALCERYQVDTSARVKHGALIDVKLLAQVYLRMTRGQQGLDLSPLSQGSHTVSPVNAHLEAHSLIHLPVISVSDAACQCHAAYLDALAEEIGSCPLWRVTDHH